MTLHDIESALPRIIDFDYCNSEEAEVNVYDNYMGMIYSTEYGLFYKAQCYCNDRSEYLRVNTFLSYFNYVLLLNIQFRTNDLQIYKLEPKFRVVYK